MGKRLILPNKKKNQRGTVILLVAVSLFVLFGFAALAIDISHLFVVRNELRNAADAGALAGARVLYLNDGTAINTNANQEAYDAAIANNSEKVAVDVHWTSGNSGDVQRGHWSFATRNFTANDSTTPPELWNRTTAELDADPNFINAVRVQTRRQDTPAASFFARIFGFESFFMIAESVAYIGFAGTLAPQEVDQPIAICRESILVGGEYQCGVGRMINSGSNTGHQTGGWTNFSQPCETASASSVRPLVCGSGNPGPINLGGGMGTTGGELQTAFDGLINCWRTATELDTNGDGWPDLPWRLTLPVVTCEGNNVGPCSEVVGAVELDIVWITRNDKNQMKEVPRKMGDWTCDAAWTAQQCWNGAGDPNLDSFVKHFNLQDVLNGSQAFYEDKTIYFLPNCAPHIPSGRTGGENFGILAKIPVLVQ